ncbi:septal ring lytic transglycosylase RlpA family protein [Polymorphum gilvum]|uniref:Endolytic peptidoglycan transglycosylase RlpA n=1 Tax=Polymorphum gilvum (strain LMG 25793 / CGMCC 1.9160 / SL003B-26A1) TaxID=991905 RepID=F2IZX7_POLGS|nr:septal ring lytic transglycosylase RlpA family protein [Polymorphum gilvum]ADZ70703.1 Rare lipoprotein A [Polymorphum gilvum SL003B-26A1]
MRRDRLGALKVAAVVLAAAVALAGCESAPKPKRSSEYFPESKYGVKASPRVVADGKPVPKGGGRYHVGQKYKVAGRWYHPKEDPNYDKSGNASWYGSAFHGRKTANGEIYDRKGLTAAHPTLPLPSYARVTNLENGRSMVVRINDRGPFHGNRVIDLSERVATMLDTKAAGIGKVRVQYVGPARLDGQDEAYLMASYTGPDAVTPGGTMPGTMIAQAAPPAPLDMASAPSATGYAPSRAPAPRPLDAPVLLAAAASGAPAAAAADPAYRLAYDPALAFETGQQTIVVASLNTFTPAAAPQPQASAQPVSLGAAPQPLGTLPSPGPLTGPLTGPASQPGVQPAAYAPPAPAGVLGTLPAATNGPRNLLMGGAISSYAAHTRIAAAHDAFGAFETFGDSSLPLALLAGPQSAGR